MTTLLELEAAAHVHRVTTWKDASRVEITRIKQALAILAVLGAGFVSCGAHTKPSANETLAASTTDGSEQRIETLIHSWFAQLEDPTIDSSALAGLLADSHFELRSAEQTLRSPSELRDWISRLRTADSQVEFEIDSIRIESVLQDQYHARFEFNRRSLDESGLSHVARREHAWTIRTPADATPILLEIEEHPLLPYPGTGPQIVCY
jgi:hypothetical protein